MKFKLILLMVGILALDMVSKGLTHHYFRPFEYAPHYFPFGGISIFKGVLGIDFCIHHVTNKGIAWGMAGAWQELILIVRIAIIGGLAFYLRRAEHKIALALIIAGGLGNIVDYFLYGHVIDMFHFILGRYSFPVFNVADMSIFFGIVTLLLKGLKKQNVIEKSH